MIFIGLKIFDLALRGRFKNNVFLSEVLLWVLPYDVSLFSNVSTDQIWHFSIFYCDLKFLIFFQCEFFVMSHGGSFFSHFGRFFERATRTPSAPGGGESPSSPNTTNCFSQPKFANYFLQNIKILGRKSF